MENPYDAAHRLAAALKDCPEYKEYQQAKDIAMQNDTQRALLEEYKRLQFQLQFAMAGGGQADPAELERLQKIAAVLQMSSEATAFMLAEFRFQRILSDIYKIIGDAAGVDMDALIGK